MAESILIVDDEDIIRESLSFVLSKEGYRVREAPNGLAALEILKEDSIDLVVTDLAMPVMSGIELLRIARERYPELLCVVLTFHQELEYAQDAIRLGAIDYIAKVQLEREQFDAVLARGFQNGLAVLR